MTSTATWIEVSEEEARENPLYGVGGWLLMLVIGLLLALVKLLGEASSLAGSAGMGLGEMFGLGIPIVGFYKLALGAQLVQTAAVCWMMAAKAQVFRLASSWILILTSPSVAAVQLIFNPFEGAGTTVGEMLIPWILSCAVWVTYLNLSRRVRVTFEHRIRGDAAMTMTEAPTASDRDKRKDLPHRRLVRGHTEANATTQEAAAEEYHWAEALAEFDGPARRPGLWARSFVQAQGDEVKAKVFYLAARSDELARSLVHHADGAGPTEKDATSSASAASPPLPQEATCPNCSKPLLIADQECRHCKAFFGPGATWAPVPLATS